MTTQTETQRGRRVLNWSEIVRLYDTGKLSFKQIGEIYGRSKQCIHHIYKRAKREGVKVG